VLTPTSCFVNKLKEVGVFISVDYCVDADRNNARKCGHCFSVTLFLAGPGRKHIPVHLLLGV
jgi:hypothetical protein